MADDTKNQNSAIEKRLQFFCTVGKCNGPMVIQEITLIEGEVMGFRGYCASCLTPLRCKYEISEIIRQCPPRREPKPTSLDAVFSDADRSLLKDMHMSLTKEK